MTSRSTCRSIPNWPARAGRSLLTPAAANRWRQSTPRQHALALSTGFTTHKSAQAVPDYTFAAQTYILGQSPLSGTPQSLALTATVQTSGSLRLAYWANPFVDGPSTETVDKHLHAARCGAQSPAALDVAGCEPQQCQRDDL